MTSASFRRLPAVDFRSLSHFSDRIHGHSQAQDPVPFRSTAGIPPVVDVSGTSHQEAGDLGVGTQV